MTAVPVTAFRDDPVAPELFRDALAAYPTGVTIVTTTGRDGRWVGFTATSFTSVSLDPPLVLVCLARTARCHPDFAAAARWTVHLVPAECTDLATRFASSGTDKFAGGRFTPDEHGVPTLRIPCWRLSCRTHAIHEAGDHTILIGEVDRVRPGPHNPAVYCARRYHRLSPL